MPSQDRIDPKLNAWMTDGPSGPTPATSPASESISTGASGDSPPRSTKQAGFVQLLAKSLGANPEELAARIPEDTLRRLKYPFVADRDAAGRLIAKEPSGIVEGRKSLLATDRGTEGVEKPGQPRSDATGRFTK